MLIIRYIENKNNIYLFFASYFFILLAPLWHS